MNQLSSVAYYDTLAITAKLQEHLDRTALSELHLFAYLACLLALYRGKPVSDWGYGFVATENGSPFSPELGSAVRRVVAQGLVVEFEQYLTINAAGREEHAILQQLSQYNARDEFIEAACSSVLAVPLGVIKSAVSTDHDMKIALQLHDTRRLLSDPALERLHATFEALTEEVGIDVKDLIVPAVVWISFLASAEEVPPLMEAS
jgi:hypothetical protein